MVRPLDMRVYGPPLAKREELEAQVQTLHRITAVLVERLGGKVTVTEGEIEGVWNGKLTVGEGHGDDFSKHITISYRRRG